MTIRRRLKDLWEEVADLLWTGENAPYRLIAALLIAALVVFG